MLATRSSFPARWRHHVSDVVAADIQICQRPIGDYLRRQHDRAISAHLLAAHVQLGLVTLVAAERLQRPMVLEDRDEVLCLLGADVVVEEVGRHQCPDGGMDGAGVSKMYIRMAWDLLALGEEGRQNNRTRSTQLFAAEVGFGRDRPRGDRLCVAKGDSFQRPLGGVIIAIYP